MTPLKVLLGVGFILALGTTEGGVLSTPGTEPNVTCDDCFNKQILEDPFVFYCKPHNAIFINENGVLSFERDFWHFIPEALPLTSETNPEMAIIAAFWDDHNIEEGGKISVRRQASNQELNKWSSYIKYLYPGCHNDFKPTTAVVATYENVKPFCTEDFPGKANTYQVVTLTDGVDSYVMMNYHTLQWNAGCGEEYAIAGFNAGDGVNSLKLIDEVGTSDVLKLKQKHNCGLRARYVYRVSGSQMVPPGCSLNDKCPTKPTDLPCVCRRTKPPMVTYDGLDMAITGPQKTVLSQWGNYTKDPCKFNIVARSFDTYQNQPVPLYVEWLAINIGNFPKENRKDKFGRSYKVAFGEVYVRGPNTKDDTQPIDLPHNWVSDDGNTDIMIYKEGNTVMIRGNRCPYALDVTQNGRLTTSYKVYAGAMYQDGQLDGMCGDCDGNAANDMRLCGGQGSAANSAAVTASCAKEGLQLVG